MNTREFVSKEAAALIHSADTSQPGFAFVECQTPQTTEQDDILVDAAIALEQRLGWEWIETINNEDGTTTIEFVTKED